ncbi:MAG: single-stranded DNA-binding protein [Eubacteriales bacterium]|nr:single-stranded DNA-binding protein [Eubacteriales bacterium]
MNKAILMGRLTRDIEVRYTQGDNPTAVARYTLAVNRRFARDGEQEADFISCVEFGKSAEFAEKWFRQGTKIVVTGRIQTGGYTNKDGQKVYTTEVVVEDQEFAESKAASESHNGSNNNQGYSGGANRNTAPSGGYGSQGGQRNSQGYRQQSMQDNDGFMKVDDSMDEELPW